MNRRTAPTRHGSRYQAPEEALAHGESPAPGDVSERRPGSGFWSRVLFVLRVTAGILVVAGASAAVAFSAHRYALTSSRFALQTVEVTGGKRFGPDEVRAMAELELGENLFSLDTKAVEQALLKSPWIASVRVSRSLPHALEVAIAEREAEALSLVGEMLYLVSREGEPFKRVESGDSVDLPVITGISADTLGRDRARELERMVSALDVLRQYQRLGMSKTYVAQEVHLGEGGSVTLTVGREAITLSLGSGSLRQRLLMAERVVVQARRAGRPPAIVFADNQAHPERVVVRLR